MRVAPSTIYWGISIHLSSGLSGLLQLVVRRTRLAVAVVSATDHFFGLERSFSGPAARASTYSSARISADGDDATWTGHLKFKISVMRYHIEMSEGHSSK